MTYISILRGINVSGQKKIKMLELKALFESLGFQNVITYIQSGNVIFDVDDNDKTHVKTIIEELIVKRFSFHVPVIMRTKKEFENLIKACPFHPVDSDKDGTKVLVTFLDTQPVKDKLKNLLSHVVLPEKLVHKGNEIYLHCPNGYGKSKLSNTFIENKLKVDATTRNWKSVLKLSELSADLNT